MWQFSTTRSRSQISQSGSHSGRWMPGRPIPAGFDAKLMARQPLSSTRSISSTVSATSHIGTSAIGMNRVGWAPHHSSMCQSL